MKKIIALFLVAVMCFSLVACGGKNESSNGEPQGNETGSQQENGNKRPENLPIGAVEVTLDNWQQYFNLKDFLKVNANGFDEIESVWLYKVIELKEEYIPYCDESKIAFEIKLTKPQLYQVEGNRETGEVKFLKTYTLDEITSRGEEDFLEHFAEVTKTSDYTIYGNTITDACKMNSEHTWGDSVTVVDDAVTFDMFWHESCELTRVKGTLTFVEKPLKKLDLRLD